MPEDFPLSDVFVVDKHSVITAPVRVFDTTAPRIEDPRVIVIPVVVILN